MMYSIILMVLVLLLALTIANEYLRTRSVTLLSILSVGNIAYAVITPTLFYYSPDLAASFELLLSEAGIIIREAGLIRVLVAATIFQFVCLCASFSGRQKREVIGANVIDSKALIKAALGVGWVMVAMGVCGVALLGMKYNGHPWGLYEISYFDRAALSRASSEQSFLLLLGIYGASQLIVVYLLSNRANAAILILLAVTLHGVGMKSKFPVFWILIVFTGVAIGRGTEFLRLFLPAIFSILVLATLSVLRGVENWSDLPIYIALQWDLLGTTVATPWENDLPGPASMMYFIINSNKEYTLEPLIEVVKLLIPKFVFDRGPVLADVFSQKMLGSTYEPGLGFGWSPICDGFLFAGWVGVGLFAFVFAGLARYLDYRRANGDQRLRQFFTIVCYSSIPSFLYGVRESTAGLVKQMLIVTTLVWLPTLYFYLCQQRKLRALKVQ